jgi:1-acyl-sn-glycerol-3-phosphate acyltransferase
LYCQKNPLFCRKTGALKFRCLVFYKRTCILVDRGLKAVWKFLAGPKKNQSWFECLYFPEGGVPDDESILLDTFKDGAFRLLLNIKFLLFQLLLPIIKKVCLILFLRKSWINGAKIHSEISTIGKNGLDENNRSR